MKRFPSTLTLLLLIFAIYWGFRSQMPGYRQDLGLPASEFSTDRALAHVKALSQKPHAVGFPAHKEVSRYIVDELVRLGLQPQLQEGYTGGDWANLSKATNIMVRLEGTGDGKALLLLSHYDSSPHSSLGASDAGSGVATILEGLRAFLASQPVHRNDIIILITDAEELGLNGADLFVNRHPWAQDVGVVLNFEARGSGGPSYMLMETNGGNAGLIREFKAADPRYPVANSLMYSVYKMLPNDTDLTVFREDGNIDGFNFAFIDDHFDYHTVRDNYERLDRNTLAHQGSYLMPLLGYFANSDLSLKDEADFVYFNLPFFGLVTYPNAWIWPIFAISAVFFLVLVLYGLKEKHLNGGQILRGFIPAISVLAINGIIGYFAWKILVWAYPSYADILHGFPYNGHTYITAFVLMTIAICFWVYAKFKKLELRNLLVAPAFLWIVLCGALTHYLPGANFFVIPVIAFLVAFMVILNQKRPNALLLVFLALPALWVFAPFIKMFPVGLGLKMMVSATLLTALLFLLLLPIVGFYRRKRTLAWISLLLFFGFMVSAHFKSGFTPDRPKPTSLLYVQNTKDGSSQWATYERVPSEWTKNFLGEHPEPPKENLSEKTLSSKYGSDFSYVASAPDKNIAAPLVTKKQDTLIGSNRLIEISITPQRPVNRLEVFTNDLPIVSAQINGVPLKDDFLANRRRGKLVTHYISDNDATTLRLTIPKDEALTLTLYEASNDLLTNGNFSVPQRPDDNIPMPFVLNDAIVTITSVSF